VDGGAASESAHGPTERGGLARELLEAQEAAGMGSWAWDVGTDQVVWSRGLYRVYGLDPAGSPPTRGAYLQRVHAEDRGPVIAAIEGTLRTGQAFEHDHRIVRGDGAVRWVHARGEAIFDRGTGRLLGLRGYCHDVTERRRTEQVVADRTAELEGLAAAHRQAGAWLRAVLDSAPDALVVLDDSGHVLMANAGAEVFGWSREHLVGRSLDALVPGWEGPSGAPLVGHRRDGSRFPVEVRLGPHAGDAQRVVQVRDVTERERMAILLHARERRASALASLLSEALAGSPFAVLHERTCALLVQVLGAESAAYLEAHHGGRAVDWVEVSREGPPLRIDDAHRGGPQDEGGSPPRPSQPMPGAGSPHAAGPGQRGAPVRVAVVHQAPGGTMAAALPGPGGVEAMVAVHRDPREPFGPEEARFLRSVADVLGTVAQRGLAEEATARAMAELARSNHDLEEFASAASHDLQEPLRVTKGYLQLLQGRLAGDDGRARSYVQAALEASERMERLIRDLLRLARVASRGKPFEAVDAGVALAEALANLAQAVQETGARVEAGPLPRVLADPTQLMQVFQNLVGNAVKFRGEAAAVVRVRAGRTRDGWEFQVADNGIGIEPSQMDRLFRPFQRLHGDHHPGNGMGLALCRRIVERHGGRIWATSAPGKGSTFHFTIPGLPEQAGEPG
jgi:PAS domain S-box-containing protein